MSSLTTSVSLIALLLAAGAVAAFVTWRRRQPVTGPAFQRKGLLTPNEVEFFGRLRTALPDYIVLAQVSMGALLKPAVASGHKDFWATRNKIGSKIVDFVVCSESLDVVALIELDDAKHDLAKDRQRDDFTSSAGYWTVRWDSSERPDVNEIRKTVVDVHMRVDGRKS